MVADADELGELRASICNSIDRETPKEKDVQQLNRYRKLLWSPVGR
jgi:hypothetical protein